MILVAPGGDSCRTGRGSGCGCWSQSRRHAGGDCQADRHRRKAAAPPHPWYECFVVCISGTTSEEANAAAQCLQWCHVTSATCHSTEFDAKELLEQCLHNCREVWARGADASDQQHVPANPGGRQNADGRRGLGDVHAAGIPEGQPLPAHCEMSYWGAGGSVCGAPHAASFKFWHLACCHLTP